MNKRCEVCNKEFKTYPSKIKLGRGKYCSKECCLKITNSILEQNGKNFRYFKGQKAHNFVGKIVNHSGYFEIFSPEHPCRNNHNRVKEHRLMMEKYIGRYLKKDEFIHHINGDKQDNRIENLQLMSHKEHFKLHGPLVLKRWAKREVVPYSLQQSY